MTEPRFLVPAILVSLALPVTGGADMDPSRQTLSKTMQVSASSITVNARPDQPHTSFQTPTGYMPENDIRTDAVIVYSSGKDQISTWKEKGYSIQTMYGFRTGDDYIKDHKDEGQTTADGTILTCGPGSYYMVPTQSRIDAAIAFYREAIRNGTQLAVPEEPEYFAQAGYSESFKREWQDYYKEPWADPASSIEARYKSERLKAHLEWRMVKAILEDVKAQDPAVVGAVAAHSPVSYFQWNIVYPHFRVMQLPELEEMIGQVWTGTARSGCKYEGETAERTFENGFLEYSSLYNLMRGTGKRLWFLMDPLEDNGERTMEDYQSNYIKTLVGSLMFPGVDEFEVMPWPTRIFGRVPGEFATMIMSVVTMLGDIHNQREFHLDAGTEGIATFVADSMGWQRGDPGRSNYDCFYGLTLPLIMKGIPVQVAQLERTPQPKYLDPYKVLLLSYDIMKPMDERCNHAIAKWVRNGGALVLFGGRDAYDAVPEWWREKGFASPHEHLLSLMKCPSKDGTYPVGKGTVIIENRPGSYFAESKGSATELRAIVSRACGKAGIPYREQHYMMVRRGRYVAARAFDRPVTIRGRFINVLDPELEFVTNPKVAVGDLAVYADVKEMLADSRPRVMLSSSRLEAKSEAADLTSVLLSGPLGTRGVVRFSTAGKTPRLIQVLDTAGKPLPFEQTFETETLLITHDGLPDGVVVRAEWE